MADPNDPAAPPPANNNSTPQSEAPAVSGMASGTGMGTIDGNLVANDKLYIEDLIQHLSADGINIPPAMLQRLRASTEGLSALDMQSLVNDLSFEISKLESIDTDFHKTEELQTSEKEKAELAAEQVRDDNEALATAKAAEEEAAAIKKAEEDKAAEAEKAKEIAEMEMAFVAMELEAIEQEQVLEDRQQWREEHHHHHGEHSGYEFQNEWGQNVFVMQDGTQQIVSPDGTLQTISPDGTQQITSPDGTTQTIAPDGTATQSVAAQGAATVSPDGTQQTLAADGTQQTATKVAPDGTQQTVAADGTQQTVSAKAPAQDGVQAPAVDGAAKVVEGVAKTAGVDGVQAPAIDGAAKVVEGVAKTAGVDGVVKGVEGVAKTVGIDGVAKPLQEAGTVIEGAAKGASISPEAAKKAIDSVGKAVGTGVDAISKGIDSASKAMGDIGKMFEKVPGFFNDLKLDALLKSEMVAAKEWGVSNMQLASGDDYNKLDNGLNGRTGKSAGQQMAV